MHHM